MSTYRTLVLTARFWPTIGGTQTHVFELSRALAKMRFEVIVVAEKNPPNLLFCESTGSYRVYRAPIRSYNFLLFPVYVLLSFIIQCKFHANIIHAHYAIPCGLVGLLLSRVFQVPLVTTVHGIDIVNARSIRYGIRLNPAIDRLTSFVLRRANYVIACSEFVHKLVLDCGVEPGKTSVIPNGTTDPEKKTLAAETGNKKELRLQFGLPSESFLLFAPRRIVKKNGIQFLIGAAKILLKSSLCFHVVIAGDGPLRRSLEELSARLGVGSKVTFLGEVDANKLESLYIASDVVVLPSVVEAFGLPVVEAMAYQRPVITFDSGGPAEIVRKEGTGLVVKEMSAVALAEAILDLAKHPDLTERYQVNSARAVGRYDWQRIAERTEKVYVDVSQPSRRALTGL